HRPPPPDELVPQFDIVRDAVRALNLPAVEKAGFEADDLIATYARQAAAQGAEVTIVSSDKDLMQLVDARVNMLDPIRNRRIGPVEVREKFGVDPDKVIEVQALAGDSSDNVPGVPGIGVKTAAQLIAEYGDLENLLAHAGEIKQPKRRQNLIDFADQARLSLALVTLRDDVPMDETLDDFIPRAPNRDTLFAFLREQGLNSVLARLESRAAVDGVAGAPAAAEAEPAANRTYELVQDTAMLAEWIARATEAGVVAVDTETTSLDEMRADLVGVSLAVEPGRACYIPLAHKAPPVAGAGELDLDGAKAESQAPKQIPMDAALALLKPLLEDPAVLKVGHNIKYDFKILVRHGIETGPVDDTMLLSYVLAAGIHGHGLDELARLHLGRENIKFKDVAGSGRNRVTFDFVPLDAALDYAAEDAEVTLALHRRFKRDLIADRLVTVYETLERPLIAVLAGMERVGIRVDQVELARLSKDFAARLDVLAGDIHNLAGRDFNIASPKQLGEVLFDEMGLPGGKKGKTGAYGTGAEVLDRLVGEGHELPARVLDWRQLAKLKSTYADALVGQINPETGRVHTSYAQAIAATGRLSSTDPNLQNIPVRTEEGRKIRRAFIAEKDHVLLSADYSQIELRLLAHVADIAALKDAFRAGADIHAMTASQVFGVPMEDMDPITRRRAKAINFGIIYGISAFGLARQLDIPRTEAATYIETYFERYPGIRGYMEACKEEGRTQGHVTTLFGRRIHVPG
ncbi:MAG: DNA polymerase I, partial [Alphaproteobacteria bacterium]